MAAFRSRIELWAQVAGLFATAWLVWAIAIAPYRGAPAYLLSRIGWASWIAFCALAWSAFLAVILWLVTQHLAGEEEPPAMMRPASVAVWFAPATILRQEWPESRRDFRDFGPQCMLVTLSN